jgi:hypothetical protein
MGELVAAGAVAVPEGNLRVLDLQLDSLCTHAGFPEGQEFKWSPSSDSWMYSNLKDERRTEFFVRVLEAARARGVRATIVVESTAAERATEVNCSPELDTTRLLLERVQLQTPFDQQATIIADRPGGNRRAEDEFIADCLSTIRQGTRLLRNFELIALVLTTSSKLLRLLQLADLITSCTLAMVAGESQWAPPVFAAIKPLLNSNEGRIGGVGLKIHPESQFANLYHWLVDDLDYMHHNVAYPLPLPGRPYAVSADVP